MSLQEVLDGAHLVITPDFTSARFQLLAMDESLASQIEAGSQLTIKGGAESAAVICSAIATYSLRVVESSNSTLLARDAQAGICASGDPDESQRLEERTVLALGSVPHVWEVKPIAPLAEPLLDLLRPSEYRGPSAEPSTQPSSTSAQQSSQPVDDVQLFSFEALLAQVQCSRGELAELLHRIGAFCLDGSFRIVADGYWFQAVDVVLVACAEHALPLQKLSPSALCVAVQQHCEAVGLDVLGQELLLHILQRLGARDAASPAAGGSASVTMESAEVSLDLAQVARHRAWEILHSLPGSRPSMDALSFVKTWHQTLKMHDGVAYSDCFASALSGLALLLGGTHLPAGAPGVLDGELQVVPDGSSIAQQVLFLPEASLPEPHGARFAALFAAQELWRLDELEPYLQPVKGPNGAVSDMLLAHCRYVTQEDGSKLYCAK